MGFWGTIINFGKAKEQKNTEKEKVHQEMLYVQDEISRIEDSFNNATDQDIIECVAYELLSQKKKYSYLLRKYRSLSA